MRILSLDGGGIRGVLTARLLSRLERACPGFLNHVDIIAGTSTGGILALGLARGLTTEQLVELYTVRGDEIFRSRDGFDHVPLAWRIVALAVGLVLSGWLYVAGHTYLASVATTMTMIAVFVLWMVGKLDELFRSDFSAKHIEAVLKDVYGEETTLRDLKKTVLVPTFDMRAWSARVFDNLPGNERDLHMKVWEVARCTSAAPTYWPSFEWCMDGGLVANNPSDTAVAVAIKHLKAESFSRNGVDETEAMVKALKSISVVSIGTGEVPRKPPSERHDHDMGLATALPIVLDAVMDGGVHTSEFKTTQLLNGRHVRVNPKLPSVVDLADVGAIEDLIKIADLTDIEPAVRMIRERWMAGSA